MNLLFVIQLVLFSLGTVFLILVSKKSLRSFKVHGFYRFFVFEFTLSLVLLNIPYWFKNPFSPLQIVSWILLSVSILLLVQSIYFLVKHGGSKKRKNSPANFEFENTASLVKEGVYKYIRHPMYGSLLFLALGTMFKYISLFTVSLTIIILVFLFFTAKIEEKENIKFFGIDYKEYMKKTKMFVPFVL
jgi:protein-S-isoprenylcysteine O-methyltransferase Ste14